MQHKINEDGNRFLDTWHSLSEEFRDGLTQRIISATRHYEYRDGRWIDPYEETKTISIFDEQPKNHRS